MEQEQTAQVPSWFKETFESIGAEFIQKDGEVAADTPWGAGYLPKRMADMNSTQREQAQAMLKRYADSPEYAETDAINGTKTITHLPSGFAINSDNFMLTAGQNGQYEVTSMFDIGMMTGELTRGKAEMDAMRLALGYKPQAEPTQASNIPQATTPGQPTQEETSMGKAMLEVDESGATPPTNGMASGAPIAGQVTQGALPTKQTPDVVSFGNGAEYKASDYNVTGLNDYVASKAQETIGKGLTKAGLKQGTPEYDKAMAEQLPKFADWAANKYFKNTPQPPANAVTNPTEARAETQAKMEQTASPKPDMGPTQHWEDSVDKPTDYKRAYKNQDEYSQNYGNYQSRDEYIRSLKDTYKALEKNGKITAKDDALIADFDANQKKYYDLGIATIADLEDYKRDMKVDEAMRKSQGTLGYERLRRQEAKDRVVNEALSVIDKAVDAGGSALESINLTPSQARKVSMNRDKLDSKDGERMKLITKRANNIRFTQEMIGKADMEVLEKAHPEKRAKAWLNRYLGDMPKEERAAMFANQGMTRMVSDAVKEISGAAASDQERAYIQNWMLGAEGYDGKTVKAIMNKIQKEAYQDATDFGDELYQKSQVGWLQHLKTKTGDLKGISTDDDLLGGGITTGAPSTKREIKRVGGN